MTVWARVYAKCVPLVALALVTIGGSARAAEAPHEPTYVIKRGDTIGKIAREYKVSEDAIRSLNGLKRRDVIKPGDTITLPAPDEDSSGAGGGSPGGSLKDTGSVTAPRAVAGHKPGVVRFVRGTESVSVPMLDRRRHLNPSGLGKLSNVLRYPTGDKHAIDPRLATLIALVSDHFGGRDIIIVSGYRPYSPSQYTPHSNHNIGRAMDFIVRGIANEKVRDFCRSLRNVGVGYYPNSSFIHLDVRTTSAYWIDYAGPGQRPRYHRNDSGGEADEGAGEVPLETFRQTRLAPGDLVSDGESDGSKTPPTGTGSMLRNHSGGHDSSDSTGETSVFPGQK